MAYRTDQFIPDQDGSDFGNWSPSAPAGVTSGRSSTPPKKDEQRPGQAQQQRSLVSGGASPYYRTSSVTAAAPSHNQAPPGAAGADGASSAAAEGSSTPVTSGNTGGSSQTATTVSTNTGGTSQTAETSREPTPPPSASFDRPTGEAAGYGDAPPGEPAAEGPRKATPATPPPGGLTGAGGLVAGAVTPGGLESTATAAPMVDRGAPDLPVAPAGARQAGLEGLPLTPHEQAQQGGMSRSDWRAAPLELAQRQAAGGKYGTDYYAAYTNSGDLAAVIPAVLSDQQRVRLVDPKTGETLVEGTGELGAQQIATLATQISKDGNRKAAWQIDYEDAPGSNNFVTPGYDKADPKHDLLKTIVSIAAPLLGAAIPGIAPALGAALGGGVGSLATGGSLKEALLAAATGGVGNSLGGGFTNLLGGGGASGFVSGLSGTNALGGLMKAGQSALFGSGADAAASAAAGGLTGAAGSAALDGTVAPLIVEALGYAPGIGGALGSTALTGLTGGLGPSAPNGGAAANQPPTLDPITVTGNPYGQVGIGDLAAAGLNLPVDGSSIPGQAPQPQPQAGAEEQRPGTSPEEQSALHELFSEDTIRQIMGQTAGEVAGTYGVYTLADVLGVLNGGGGGGQGAGAAVADPIGGGIDPTAIDTGDGGGFDPGGGDPGVAQPTPPLANTPAKAVPGGSTQAFGGGGGQGALGQAMALANVGSNSGGAAPLAPAPTLNVRGSTAPDVYPWRRRPGAG